MTAEALKRLLENHQYSCILVQEDTLIMTSFDKGVKPLWQFITESADLPQGHLQVGDKIVGRAVAFLLLYLGVTSVYTKIMSETALQLLEHYPVTLTYDEVVPYIYNRNRDGQCPMEEALAETQDIEEAFEIIDEFVKKRIAYEEKAVL